MFIKYFSIFTFLLGGLMLLLIVGVDPYNKLGINFFDFKTKAVASSRENKFNMLENTNIKYEAFILGSSSAHRYETSVVKEITGLKTFNYAVQQAVPEDYFAILKHIIKKKIPKLIILQIDYYSLSANTKVDIRLYNSPLGKFLDNKKEQKQYFKESVFYHPYLTLEAIRDTFRVIFVNWFGEARHIYLEHGDYVKEKSLSGPVRTQQFHSGKYKIRKNRISYLKKIKALCKENSIKLIAFSSPRSPLHLKRMLESKIYVDGMSEFNNALTEIFPFYRNFMIFTDEKYNSRKYFQNSTHPTRYLSNEIMKSILTRTDTTIID